jgi:thiol-disulfide isomerase/thioredoxin
MVKSNVFWLVLVLVLSGMLWGMKSDGILPTSGTPTQAARIGTVAPSFVLPRWGGGTYAYTQGAQDKVVMLQFWTSWCETCQLEAPVFVQWHEKYRQSVEIIGVNVRKYDQEEGIASFIQRYRLPYTTVLDVDNALGKIYRVTGYPHTVIIDRLGIVRHAIIGFPGEKYIEAMLRRVIASKE